ncbi:MAG: CHASE2 domain-containing protein [Dysgonamonadaceae bacterium]|nr:CHASE2 domain-containing protein [Dysgonamonadaceae bacterium]
MTTNKNNNLKRRLFSAAHSLLLLIACYWLWNKPITFSDESGFIKLVNIAKKYLHSDNAVPDNILLVNVAYDRDLVDYYENGIPAGKIDITDRNKLFELFQYLGKDSSYKYIVCDVFFDATLKTPIDDSLFTLMGKMPRLVVPMHKDGKIFPSQLESKAAYADYKTNLIENNFLKFQYIQDEKKSIPLFMWEELTGGSFNSHCLWYSMNGKLATNSIILDFKVTMQEQYNKKDDYYENNYLNLGADLLELLREVYPENYFKDKIILIGDLTEHDIHDTTVGAIPGVLINYNAFLMLIQEKVAVSGGLLFLLFVVFLITSFLIISQKKFSELIGVAKIKQKIRQFFVKIYDKFKTVRLLKFFLWLARMLVKIKNNRFVQFLLSFIGYSFLLCCLNLLIYRIWGHFIEVLILGGWLAFCNDICKLFKHNKNEKKNHYNNGGDCVLPQSFGAGFAENNVS